MMITKPHILSIMEERCLRIGIKLDGDRLDRYELADIETSLLLVEGALGRYLQEYAGRHEGLDAVARARAALNQMHLRLEMLNRHREKLYSKELYGFLRETQVCALAAIAALEGKGK